MCREHSIYLNVNKEFFMEGFVFYHKVYAIFRERVTIWFVERRDLSARNNGTRADLFPDLSRKTPGELDFFARAFLLWRVWHLKFESQVTDEKRKRTNLNHKPKLKLAKFDKHSFINDVTEEQSKIVMSESFLFKMFCSRVSCTKSKSNWNRGSFSRINFDYET